MNAVPRSGFYFGLLAGVEPGQGPFFMDQFCFGKISAHIKHTELPIEVSVLIP